MRETKTRAPDDEAHDEPDNPIRMLTAIAAGARPAVRIGWICDFDLSPETLGKASAVIVLT